MGKGRILVIEDNDDNMTLLVDMLETLNYDILLASDGQEGVDLAQSHKPDAILMDLSLPVMDGWTAARMIKSDPELQHIPILALTAHAMAGDRERALEAGCDDYLAKPIDLPELVIKLKQFIG